MAYILHDQGRYNVLFFLELIYNVIHLEKYCQNILQKIRVIVEWNKVIYIYIYILNKKYKK